MALFDEIRKKVTDTTHGAVKATKDLAETTRLNAQISEEQRRIGERCHQIGKMYFDQYGTEGESPFHELCAEIVISNEKIAKFQLEIQRIKGVKHCPNCGADVPLASGFCGKCGTAVETPAALQEETHIADEVKRCPNCGALIESDAVYCGSCGHKIESPASDFAAE